MPNINITVAAKIATNMSPSVSIVCGNNDYTVTFAFDEEWTEHPIKTARFVYTRDGQVHYAEVVFSGNVVAVPVLSGIAAVYVGVYAGDLRTTTPARVLCDRSILCGGGTHEAPLDDVYNQIIEEINELIGLTGAHPTRLDNPHKVTAAQVGARSNTWLPTLSDIGAQAQHQIIEIVLLDDKWVNDSQVVSVNGLRAQDTVIVSSAPGNHDEYCEAGVRCVAQADGVLTFKCTDVPKVTLSAHLIVFGFGAFSGAGTEPVMLNMDIVEDGYSVRAEVGDEIYGVKNATVNHGATADNYDFTVL